MHSDRQIEGLPSLGDQAPPVAAKPLQYAALDKHFAPLRALLKDGVTELCVNRPHEAWTETGDGWSKHSLPDLSYHELTLLAAALGNAVNQKINPQNPMLSCALPSGERVQVVLPPCTSSGQVSLTIRKPSPVRFTLEQYEAAGFFSRVQTNAVELQPDEIELHELLKKNDLMSFFRLAVRSKKTIVVSGGTGSGKTTFMKTLADLIPSHERIISIEDTPELEILHQPNHVRLFYSKGGQGQAAITAQDCVESCMRMKPDRILQAEIRDASAYYFVEAANSGHPGSITSVHANSAALAFQRIAGLMRGAAEAHTMGREEIRDMLITTIDIIVQVGKSGDLRAATGIYYAPEKRLAFFE